MNWHVKAGYPETDLASVQAGFAPTSNLSQARFAIPYYDKN